MHSPDDLEKFPPRDLKVGLVRSGGGGELRGIVFGISGQLHLAGQVGTPGVLLGECGLVWVECGEDGGGRSQGRLGFYELSHWQGPLGLLPTLGASEGALRCRNRGWGWGGARVQEA